MIARPNELNFDEKKLSVIIAGVPGIGKTTLALSSPKPLLVDLDGGVSRVEARFRIDTLICNNYDELVNDLFNNDLSNYETIVVDTGGKLLEFLKPVVISDDPKNKKRDGSLSLQGYGAVKRKFAEFISKVKTLNKHLVLVFHATEVALTDDMTGLRIRIEGSSRDEVWDDIDIGGFVEMIGNKRTIGFSNCPRYYAKGTHGIRGIYDIPNLDSNTKNDFLTKLFNNIKNNLNKETKELNLYNETMQKVNDILSSINTLKDLNDAISSLAKLEHHLTSKDESWYLLNEVAKNSGYEYDKATKQFK